MIQEYSQTSSAWNVIEYFSSPRELRKLSSGLSTYKKVPKINYIGSGHRTNHSKRQMHIYLAKYSPISK
jgi:hypothetical protein